ncbi:hypothetical protein SCHPADRAFT_936950 [Schizopora paradoxa]|uniref:F-box domain-containing protein n=1 Tax=Schizopora paradoxa TaxID=27342 RepID=A0A0H2SKI9_9AGAM|nr:hypothetical protein SCHPADRAFT_936950 [Schizopora paradoxa]
MVSLNSLDVILYIALFLDSEKEKKDLKNLSLVNHVVYEALTRRRVKNLLVYPSDLPSLALFLIRSRASKHCRSLKISHCSKNMFGPTNFENFSRALIFRMIGTCKGSALQYFEGCCSEPTPPLLWKALKPLAHKKGGPANCIQLSAGNESGDKRTIKWLYPGSTSHRIRIISKKEQDSKPSTVHVHLHLPPTSSEVSKLLDPENERLQEIPSWRLTFEELLLSSHSIKEMVLRLLNPLSWDAILRADWPCLSRLELLVHEPQRLGESPPSHPMLNALESLKISWPNSAYSPYLVLDFTIPSLRSLHFSSWGVRQSYLNGFLSRHANHLEDLSLNCKVVPALDCLEGLRALHLSYKQDMRFTYEQLDVCFQNLQNVVHLRVSAEAFRIGTSISNATFLRNLRCLELEHLRTRSQYGFNYASNLLPELKELAFIFGEDIGDGQDLKESIVSFITPRNIFKIK